MKKFLTFILVLAMVMSVSSVAMAASQDPCTSDPCAHAAYIGTAHYDTLQEAITAAQNGDTVTLLTDCAENVTVTQQANVVITIDGADKTMSGTITVDGKSATILTAGVTIKNFNFSASNISKDAYINMGVSGDNNTRYICNLTVEDCTFTYSGNDGKEVVAIKSYTGGDKNLKVIKCEVDNTMHSLLQVKNVAGLVVEETNVNGAAEGLNLNNSTGVTIDNCNIETTGYGVRADGNDAAGDTKINNTSITADQPVVIRKVTKQYDLDISGDSKLTPAADNPPVIITSGDGKNAADADGDGIKDYADPNSNANVEYANPFEAKKGNAYYTDADAAKADADEGEEVTIINPDGTTETIVPNPAPSAPPSSEPTTKPSTGSGISVKYNGGNSFSTSKSDVPTGVEIDGVPVTFNGTGSNFSVGCISSDAKWVTVRWNSTSVTTNFTPDGLVECTTVSIPKTGDMSIWAAIAQFLGL